MQPLMTTIALAVAGMTVAAGIPVAAQSGTGQPGPRPGGLVAVPVDQPLAIAARAAAQSYFATLQLGDIQEAADRVVAGLIVQIICKVKEGGAEMNWRFTIWRKLDGTWSLLSARRLGPHAGERPAAPGPGAP